jgi:anti-sigma B factor antagonist
VKLQAPFATRVEAQDDVAIMALSGELDVSTAPILREELAQVENSGTLAIVLDLRDVTFIDSSGLNEFLEARSRAQATGIACS